MSPSVGVGVRVDAGAGWEVGHTIANPHHRMQIRTRRQGSVPCGGMPEPKRPSEIFARHLRLTREERRMSQADLAKRIGTSKTTVLRTESGQRDVSLDEALALAAVLDLTPMQLLTDDDVPVAVAPGYVANASEIQRWLAGQRPLPGQDQRAARPLAVGDDNRAQLELALRLVWGFVAALEKSVQALISAVIREDKSAVADAVDAINAQVGNSREGGIEALFENLRRQVEPPAPKVQGGDGNDLVESMKRHRAGQPVEPMKPSRAAPK